MAITDGRVAQDSGPVRYVVISPVRDEEQYLERTIDSLVSQSIQPAQWILVNDGSRDRTGAIIDSWSSREPWITPVHRYDGGPQRPDGGAGESGSRGQRASEAKEIEAFLHGYDRVTAEWDFLVKLDGDLGFAPDYFEKCFDEFVRDPTLGIGGGVICHEIGGRLRVESTPGFHVRGATKIYRRSCWNDLGGVVRGAGWDTLDEVKAHMRGWTTRSFTNLQVRHYRFTGTANGAWRNAVKNGRWSYIAGYHPLFISLRCCRQLLHPPYLTGCLGILYGYLAAYVRRVPQVDDKSLIRYLRSQQTRRMLCLPSIWK